MVTVTDHLKTDSLIYGLVTAALFVAVGAFALFRARKIQQFGLNYYARNPDIQRFNLFSRYMATNAYVVVTRIVGLIASIVGMSILFLIVRACLNANRG